MGAHLRSPGRPLSFTYSQRGQHDTGWKLRLEKLRAASAAGRRMTGQSLCRPLGAMMGWDVSFNPFTYCPTFDRLQQLPLAERVAELRRPEVRALLMGETPAERNPQFQRALRVDALGDPPNYARRGTRAARRSAPSDALALAYDAMLRKRRARSIRRSPTMAASRFDGVLTMLRHPDMIFGSRRRRNSGLMCDAVHDVHADLLTRDRGGEKLTPQHGVSKLTHETARTLGLRDRGIVAPGYKADLNVIDYDR